MSQHQTCKDIEIKGISDTKCLFGKIKLTSLWFWLDARNEQRDVTSKWYIPWPNTAVRDDAAVQDSSTIKAGNLLMNTNDDVYGKLVHKNSRDIYIHTYRLIFTTLKSLVYICHIWSMTKTNGRLGKCDTHPNRLLRKFKKTYKTLHLWIHRKDGGFFHTTQRRKVEANQQLSRRKVPGLGVGMDPKNKWQNATDRCGRTCTFYICGIYVYRKLNMYDCMHICVRPCVCIYLLHSYVYACTLRYNVLFLGEFDWSSFRFRSSTFVWWFSQIPMKLIVQLCHLHLCEASTYCKMFHLTSSNQLTISIFWVTKMLHPKKYPISEEFSAMGTNQESHPSHQSLTWPGRNRDALCRWCRDKDSNVYPSRVWGSHAWSGASSRDGQIWMLYWWSLCCSLFGTGRAIPFKKKETLKTIPPSSFQWNRGLLFLTSLQTELLPGVLIGHGKDYNSQHHQEVQQGCQETSALPHTLRTGLGLSPSHLDAGCIYIHIDLHI